jgi:hypothetical protein
MLFRAARGFEPFIVSPHRAKGRNPMGLRRIESAARPQREPSGSDASAARAGAAAGSASARTVIGRGERERVRLEPVGAGVVCVATHEG